MYYVLYVQKKFYPWRKYPNLTFSGKITALLKFALRKRISCTPSLAYSMRCFDDMFSKLLYNQLFSFRVNCLHRTLCPYSTMQHLQVFFDLLTYTQLLIFWPLISLTLCSPHQLSVTVLQEIIFHRFYLRLPTLCCVYI